MTTIDKENNKLIITVNSGSPVEDITAFTLALAAAFRWYGGLNEGQYTRDGENIIVLAKLLEALSDNDISQQKIHT
jgi:hypothetical protein